MSLPTLKGAAAPFPFAGLTSSKAEDMCRTHGHRGHKHGQSHSRLQRSCCLRPHPHSADTGTDNHSPSFSQVGRGRRSLVQLPHHSPQVHKHTHIHGSPKHWYDSFACPAPIPGSQLPLPVLLVSSSPASPAECSLHICSTHALFPQAPHTHACPETPAQTLCPPDAPAQIQSDKARGSDKQVYQLALLYT